MKRRELQLMLFLALAASLFTQSCDNDEEGHEIEISSYNSEESHHSGANCMDCHKNGGSGESLFSIAGTVYDSTLAQTYPNALLSLYTAPGGTGTLLTTIEVDLLGNFYSTEPEDMTMGLYPAISGNAGTIFMLGSVTSGECNSCHGESTAKIWTK